MYKFLKNYQYKIFLPLKINCVIYIMALIFLLMSMIIPQIKFDESSLFIGLSALLLYNLVAPSLIKQNMRNNEGIVLLVISLLILWSVLVLPSVHSIWIGHPEFSRGTHYSYPAESFFVRLYFFNVFLSTIWYLFIALFYKIMFTFKGAVCECKKSFNYLSYFALLFLLLFSIYSLINIFNVEQTLLNRKEALINRDEAVYAQNLPLIKKDGVVIAGVNRDKVLSIWGEPDYSAGVDKEGNKIWVYESMSGEKVCKAIIINDNCSYEPGELIKVWLKFRVTTGRLYSMSFLRI
jgi:hypothetical protein